jgi:hypothetical protein
VIGAKTMYALMPLFLVSGVLSGVILFRWFRTLVIFGIAGLALYALFG